MKELKERYLERLSELYPTIAKASTEIINLQAILNLPKGTEHFLTDIHGEYEAFSHVLKNGSGSVRRKIDDVFGNTLSSRDKQSLATLIYYPKEKMDRIRQTEESMEDWYKITLYRLIEVCKCAASKYTRSKVRKALPKEFAYVIEELITVRPEVSDKESYYNSIVSTIIGIGRAEPFIVALSELIQRLTVDHLHIVGDIYDRGPGPHIIMDKLKNYHSVDIQWGNHDVLWMGAAAGQRGCIANVIRICARYGNLDILEDGYGINLLPLATFALRVYKDDPCECFKLKGEQNRDINEKQLEMRMHKAVSVIQFKVEGQIIKKNPGFHLEDRNLLDKIDYERGAITLDGKEYEMLDINFPTIDPKHPYALSNDEEEIMSRLESAFLNCEKLQDHMRFLLNKGGLYKVYNGNLLYHGCVPLDESGNLEGVAFGKKRYHGREYLDYAERIARRAWSKDARQKDRDFMWYLWCGRKSPLSGRNIKTFERTYVLDENTWFEQSNPYYKFYHEEKVCNMILHEFGLYSESSHIINGHTPVRTSKGEHPVRANGKLLVIDGGFCKSYHKTTGIAGYTLIFNSHGIRIKSHQPFQSVYAALTENKDIESKSELVETESERLMVRNTDNGKKIKEDIEGLKMLLRAYRSGDFDV